MSNTELTCANGSREQKNQRWAVFEGEAFEIDFDRAYGMILDSGKGRYGFTVAQLPGMTVVACTLVWATDHWELDRKHEDFSLGTLSGGTAKLTCLL